MFVNLTQIKYFKTEVTKILRNLRKYGFWTNSLTRKIIAWGASEYALLFGQRK